MTDTATGSCLCGAVRYQVTGPLRDVVTCHCSMCRKTSGHFGAFTMAERNRFRLTEERGLAWYRSSAHSRRGFCKYCGGQLFFDTPAQSHIGIAAGTLDGATGLCLEAEIYCVDKGDYYDLDPRVPHYAQEDDGPPMAD